MLQMGLCPWSLIYFEVVLVYRFMIDALLFSLTHKVLLNIPFCGPTSIILLLDVCILS
jgi:hypothetical protein